MCQNDPPTCTPEVCISINQRGFVRETVHRMEGLMLPLLGVGVSALLWQQINGGDSRFSCCYGFRQVVSLAVVSFVWILLTASFFLFPPTKEISLQTRINKSPLFILILK